MSCTGPEIVNPVPNPTTDAEWDAVHLLRCDTCGQVVPWVWGSTMRGPWLFNEKHDAPCGSACMGGGIGGPGPLRPKLDAAHKRDSCGAPGCNGGPRSSTASTPEIA